MARIRGYSEEEVDLLIADFERVVQRSIDTALKRTANDLHSAIVADASSAGLSVDDVAVFTEHWSDEVDGVLTPYIGEVYTGSAAQVAIGLGDAFPDGINPGVPLVADDFALDYMANATNRLVGVSDELWEDIRNELVDGVKQGQSIAQIRDRIAAIGNFDPTRAARVARTEVHGATEAGSLEQMKFVGYTNDDATKEWLFTHDLRTRLTHQHVTPNIVGIDDTFIVGGAKLKYPGDPGGPAGEIINCRCSTAYDIKDPPKMRCGGELVSAATATVCVVPVAPADISMLPSNWQTTIFNLFMSFKISPAYGGAKIHKVLGETRDALKKDHPDIEAAVNDDQILAIIDGTYVAKAETFGQKYYAWLQSPAGQKAVLKTPHKAVTTPITPTATPTPPTPPPATTLPPVAPKPTPSEIQFTGQTLGSHGAQVWKNPTTGDKWLFKPQSEFMSDLDVAMAHLASKANLTRPGVYKIKLNNKNGSIQYMFDSKGAFPGHVFDPTSISSDDLLILQREQIFDWMISNFDAHTDQFVRLNATGQVVGVDKGQAFKFFGHDKLDWTYVPPGNIGTWIYPKMWTDYINGKNVSLQDPTTGELGAFIDRLMAIPDSDYKALLMPYASQVKSGPALTKFLTDAVTRKNSLKKDFADFWQRVQTERALKSPGVPPPTPPAPPVVTVPTIAPAPVAASPVPAGVNLTVHQWSVLGAKWKAIADGKKVTPAWGGAKIYKQLQDLKKDPEFTGLDDLTLLKALDQDGGFVGKPKTYESVVKAWVAEPKSATTIHNYGVNGKLDPSLQTTPPAPAIVTPPPVMSPISPVTATFPDEAADVLATGTKGNAFEVFGKAKDYKLGEVFAYAKTINGDTLRVTRMSGNKVAVAVRKDSLGKTTWDYDKSFDDYTDLNSEYAFATGDYSPWSFAPTTVTQTSKIPGKKPFDIITPDEIFASKNLWKDGDVIASDSLGLQTLKSNGNGGISFHVGATKLADITAKNQISMYEWHAGPDIIGGAPKSSLIAGKNVGDVITVDEAWNAGANLIDGDVIAYAMSVNGQAEYRLVYNMGKVQQQYRQHGSSGPWNLSATASNQQQLDVIMNPAIVTWRVAKLDGTAPDEHKVVLTSVSKILNYAVGEKVTPFVMWASKGNFDPFEIIAEGKNVGGTKYRFYWVDDTYIGVEKKTPTGGGGWTAHQIIKSDNVNELPVVMHWKVASGKASTTSVGTKAVIKLVNDDKAAAVTPTLSPNATHFPNVSVGDDVKIDDIWDNFKKYDSGTVIAEGHKGGWDPKDYRLVVIYDQLVLQKKTASGAWAGNKHITAKYQLPSSYSVKWKALNDTLPAPKHKSLKKFVDKKINPAAAPTATHAPTATPTPSPVMLRTVDLSPWNVTEQDEIAKWLSTNHSITSHSSLHNVWTALQAAKSHFQIKYGGKYAGLNEIEILRIFDAYKARKAGVTDTHLLEIKVVSWLKTPAGKYHVNRRIDAPIIAKDVPIPREDFAASSIPADQQTYRQITLSEALQYRAESWRKYGDLSTAEKAATRKYTGGSYTAWNEAIRKGDLGSYKSNIVNAQKGMRPSTRPMLLHRRVGFAELNDPTIVDCASLSNYVGHTYVNRGFNSTAVGGPAWSGALLIEIEAPIGTPMAHVADYSHYPSERETTLAAHLIYQILKVDCTSYGATMRVRVIGVGKP